MAVIRFMAQVASSVTTTLSLWRDQQLSLAEKGPPVL